MTDIETVLNADSGVVISHPGSNMKLLMSHIKSTPLIPESQIVLNDLMTQKKLAFSLTSFLKTSVSDLGPYLDDSISHLEELDKNEDDHLNDFELAKSLIDRGRISKMVVFSHSLYQCPNFNKRNLLAKLLKSQDGYLYLIWTPEFTLFGRTPENLFFIDKDLISFDTLAGTTQSEFKDHHHEENYWVEKHIRAVSEKYSINLDSKPMSQKKHGDIKHLYKSLSGIIAPNTPIQNLLWDISPTPALGGYPRHEFLNFFPKTKYYQSNTKSPFYGGNLTFKFGDITQSMVLIRGACIQNNHLIIDAGGGIVADSNWDEERSEVILKKKYIYELLTN